MAYNAERLALADATLERMEDVIAQLGEARRDLPAAGVERAAIEHTLYTARAALMDIRWACAVAAGVAPPIAVHEDA